MVKQKTSDKTLVISFSGGRTSGYLTKRLLEEKSKWKDVIVIFANTGQEHEKTLEFINPSIKKIKEIIIDHFFMFPSFSKG